LEFIIVIGVFVALAGIGADFYLNYAKESELEMTAKNILSDLRQAQAKAMAGEESRKWGVHFINDNDDYYEIFSTPTNYNDILKTIEATSYLPANIFFTEPGTNASSTILFDKIKGTTSGISTIVISSTGGNVKTITVTVGGNIY